MLPRRAAAIAWSSSSPPPRRARSPGTWAGTMWWSRASATSGTCPTRQPRFRSSSARSRGRGSAWTWTTTSRPCTSCTRTRSPRSRSSSRRSRAPTNSCSRRTRTARARRSPGTCSRSSSPRSRPPHGLPRDHARGDRRSGGPPPRPGPRPGGRVPDPARARPPVRVRGLAGAVEEGHAAAVRGPGPVGRHPPRRGQGAGAHRVPPGRVLGSRGGLHHCPCKG